MGNLLEPLILYLVLFLPSFAGTAGKEMSVTLGSELYRIFIYDIPSLALIWYLLFRNPAFIRNSVKFRKNDLVSAAIALPALLLTGFTIALVSPYFTAIPHSARITPPSGIAAWAALAFSCLFTGYLEESFFRFYLLTNSKSMGVSPAMAVLVSTLLFSVCHIYEGPWGFLNAVISGLLLAFVFMRYRSLHGIALSHGLYNIIAYVIACIF